MVNKYASFLLFITVIFGQISMSDINKLSNEQLDLIRSELKGNPLSPDANQVTNDKIDIPINQVTINPSPSLAPTEYFGYNYFKRDINFFDNIPTPSDFKLGPGDEIILSLWGETNSRESFIISKEGLIFYENVGFINLSNKTLLEAEEVLINELSRIYSTLKDKNNPTQLMIELGQIKSINVYFSGQIESPGINLIHPFSDIFSAIVQSGGIKNEGSLRNVKLIRDGKIISTFDFYSFFISGKNNFSNIKILDGDIIHIPEISTRAQILGEVVTPGYFELLENESIATLINYAGGFLATASSYAIIDMIIPISERSSDDNARESKNISSKEFSNISINNGDSITILPIGDVETKVEIFGRVKFPGAYPASSNLKSILDIAGGFNDPLYRKTIRDDGIVVVRKDKNQFYGLEFKIPYSESEKFNLIPGDRIFVYENTMYNNLLSISIKGEVNKRGNFQLKSGMTVKDAIDFADLDSEAAHSFNHGERPGPTRYLRGERVDGSLGGDGSRWIRSRVTFMLNSGPADSFRLVFRAMSEKDTTFNYGVEGGSEGQLTLKGSQHLEDLAVEVKMDIKTPNVKIWVEPLAAGSFFLARAYLVP